MWTYKNAGGAEIGYVVRYDDGNGQKDVVPFFMRKNGQWNAGGANEPRPLFGLDVLAARGPGEAVFVVEGEKCAAALHGLAAAAVTSAGGARAAGKADWTPLARFGRVYILPDADEAGEAYARDVTAALAGLPGQREVFVVRLPNLPEGGDVADWLKALLPDWDGFGPVPREPGDELEDELRETVEAHAEPVPPEWLDNEGAFSQSNAWEVPVPLDAAVVPEWPRDVLPPDIQAYVNALAESTETPVELAAMAVLAVLATAVQGKHRIRVKEDYFEPLCLWTCCALPSGSRKSAVLDAAVSPLVEWERLERERLEPVIAEAESEEKTFQEQIKALRSRAGKPDASEVDDLTREITELERRVPVVPTLPRLWTSDVTPERLAVLMQENEERMAVLCDESGVLDTVAGRYSKGVPNLDLFLQGHAGTAVRVDRGSRPPVFLQRPCLTVYIAPQPDVVQALSDKPGFRGRGLLGRFLYALPESNLGRRTGQAAPRRPDVVQRYNSIIHALLYRTWNTDANGQPCAAILKLAPGAADEWQRFSLEVEAGLAAGGAFCHITDWAGKLPGAVARLAGVFHLARHAFERAERLDVSAEDMAAAVRLGRVLGQQALIAFDCMGADAALEDARAVLAWIRRDGLQTFTRREAHAAHKHRFQRVNELQTALDVLVERHYVRQEPRPTGPRGGRPSAVYEVNPAVLGAVTAGVWQLPA
ncbi:MAG TPA: DUF3987 domain-containing protein [Candidatus Hydrogenedentes bacterium]|nr:DUF3987 domain-containing protein [Candidatus Hydrogenedentota bacterium]